MVSYSLHVVGFGFAFSSLRAFDDNDMTTVSTITCVSLACIITPPLLIPHSLVSLLLSYRFDSARARVTVWRGLGFDWFL